MLFFRYRAVNVCPVSAALGGLYFDSCCVSYLGRVPVRGWGWRAYRETDSVFEPSARSLFKSVFSPRINFFLDFTKPAHPGTAVVT